MQETFISTTAEETYEFGKKLAAAADQARREAPCPGRNRRGQENTKHNKEKPF